MLAENRALGQFEALRSGLTPLLGREEELELLLRCWAQAKGASGQVVLIAAEPGSPTRLQLNAIAVSVLASL